MNTRRKYLINEGGKRPIQRARKGSVVGLFAILLPAMLALSALAINVAYIQLVNTELRIATDASARAAGRAMSIHQTTDAAMDYAESTAALNLVAGQPLVVEQDETYVQFGMSARGDGGNGRYEFTPVAKSRIDSRSDIATSVRILGSVETSTLFPYSPALSTISPKVYSTSTQTDRDIALILDRSGSMGEYQDWSGMRAYILQLYSDRLISKQDKNQATRNLYSRVFTDNLKSYLTGDMHEYADTYDAWISGGTAPAHSKWRQLDQAVTAFVDVLNSTDQEELVSVASFSDSATLDLELELDYDQVRNLAANTRPYGDTAIGQGLQEGLPSLLDANRARPFASKTIVVLTDGINNANPDPVEFAKVLVAENNITIHTITFSEDADQSAMIELAKIGHGTHYHANTGNELVKIFQRIANTLPTMLTE